MKPLRKSGKSRYLCRCLKLISKDGDERVYDLKIVELEWSKDKEDIIARCSMSDYSKELAGTIYCENALLLELPDGEYSFSIIV